MLLIRPIRPEDLDGLMALASQAGVGLTTLPHDAAFLSKRIKGSVRSFEDAADEPGGEIYQFVLEDTASGRIFGTSGIASKAGGFEPLYNYRIDTVLHESAALHVRKEVPVLTLVTAHSGPCEIGGLFLDPAFRRGGSGRLLSLSRFLFMAEHPTAFDPMVIAEIRGVVDAAGRSPFWDALGRHFFEVDFPRADYLSILNKRFIADLMPRHPIYLCLLPDAARRVIGVPHAQSVAAMRMLEQEGFRYADRIDIFDAGPVVTCPLSEIRTVQESRRATVTRITAGSASAGDLLISNTRRHFRACLGSLTIEGDGVGLSNAYATALDVRVGDAVRYAPVRSERKAGTQ